MSQPRFLVPLANWLLVVSAAVIGCSLGSVGYAQVSFEQPPIDYLKAQRDDVVVELQQRLAAGESQLEYRSDRGYLESVLKALEIPPSSQVLVYSKTSFQLKRITPRTPRALYFNDDVYIGWVQDGDVMEVSTVDPQLGANFYTLAQAPADRPEFTRHTHECLQCHGSSMTLGVPGHTVRSVFTAPDGQPLLNHPSYLTDHKSPWKERWGGWYVTGTHGDMRHLGNLLVRRADDPDNLNLEPGANVTDLSPYCDTTPYLTGHSDIVALMVLEHQTMMHNVITQANFLTRVALRDQQVLNEMLGRKDNHRSETTELRLRSAAKPVVRNLLFVGEAVLSSEVRGSTSFATEFAARGPHDSDKRTLREFDLSRRLFKYPCSYLIYSRAFDGLPGEVKELIYQELWKVLTGEDKSNEFAHLSADDRQAIREILLSTKQDLPSYWTRS